MAHIAETIGSSDWADSVAGRENEKGVCSPLAIGGRVLERKISRPPGYLKDTYGLMLDKA